MFDQMTKSKGSPFAPPCSPSGRPCMKVNYSVQNEKIECLKKYIQNKIVEEVQSASMSLSNVTSSH